MTKSLTLIAATAVIACAAANAALLVARIRQYGTEAANRASMWTGNLTGIRSGLLVLTALVFLLWLRRARTAGAVAHAAGPARRTGRRPGSASPHRSVPDRPVKYSATGAESVTPSEV